MGISDKRMEMLCPFRLSAFLLSSSNPSYSFPWQAYVGFHRCQWLPPILSVKMFNALCHSTANHLSVLDHTEIGSIDPFASVTTPSTREFEARHSHSIIESYSEYHRQGLDLPDSLECRHHSSLRHEDSG